MGESENLSPQAQRCVVITQPDRTWRVSVLPAPGDEQQGLPESQEFDDADAALAHAARLAHGTAWSVVDMTGQRSPAELQEAIRSAGMTKAADETWTETAA